MFEKLEKKASDKSFTAVRMKLSQSVVFRNQRSNPFS